MDNCENPSDEGASVRVYDAIKALAFIGDLSMGQPTDHSLRTAWLAARLGQAAGYRDADAETAVEASLLRWSGCTANAPEFADMLGDDVAGRAAMLAQRSDWTRPFDAHADVKTAISPLARIHCEVSGEVARLLGLSQSAEDVLRHIFEAWDGTGLPDGLANGAVPHAVFVVTLAGDLEIFSRVYGLSQALTLISDRAGARYPVELATLVVAHARSWLASLAAMEPARIDEAILTPRMQAMTSAELVADVIDLKLPWMTGYSRAVACAAADCFGRLGGAKENRAQVYVAGLIHGIGRAAVPNTIWNTPGTLSAAAWEKIRLVPYWTSRAAGQTGTLAPAAELASYAYERLDGSGYFRGLGGPALPLEARILSAAVACVALGERRPWREALGAAEIAQWLRTQATDGRFDGEVIEALIETQPASGQATRSRRQITRLTAREIDVLRSISRGASNKEVARQLALSPSTVRTHVESAFRKLNCSTRAAATLKASALGVL